MNIICLGEALIDFKATGPLTFQGFVGGSPLNVAVAAARLGVSVGFASQISTDLFGQQIVEYLHSNGIDTTHVLRHDAPTTLAFVAEVNGEAHFRFLANGAADTLYNPQPRPSFPTATQFVQFGSISLLQNPASDAILEVVAQHQDRCTTVLDPNVRPALIDNRQNYLEALERWLTLSCIVKVSTQDLTWLYPTLTHEQIAYAWLAKGPHAVIITNGERGASVYREGQHVVSVKPPRVNVVDTVGAGDTFTGALMVYLLPILQRYALATLSEQTWQEALRFATAAAALNCTRSGANPPDLAELDAFLQQQAPT